MGKNIIDNSAEFTCNQGIGVSFKPLPGQMIAKGNGKYFLNTNTKCVLVPGQCKLQPNPSGAGYLPCNQGQIPTIGWQGVDDVISIAGAKALTTDTSTICPLSGKISLKKSCKTSFNSGCDLSIVEIPINRTEKTDNSRLINSDNDEKKVERNAKQQNVSSDVTDEVETKEQEEKKEKKIAYKYALCDYENCEEREKCPYLNANPEVDNDAAKLKKQFEKERFDDDKEYKDRHDAARQEFSESGWGYEGHHIISGNQVFMARMNNGDLKYGHLLMLADMCGYDINNAFNCILLPSRARCEGPWGTLDTYVKEAMAFDVMDIMKRQWHLGGHEYTIPKDSLKYYKPSDFQVQMSGTNEYFPDYATSMRARLDKLNDVYFLKTCWKNKDSLEFRGKFIEKMNQISRDVESILLSFEKKPKDSYPFFVSRVAVDYAYDAPVTGKIIFLYKRNDKVYASKFRVSRLQKNNYQIIVTQNEEVPEMQVNSVTMHDFIIYCENVMYFWIDEHMDKELPWICTDEFIDKRYIDVNNIYEYAQKYSSELFTFIDTNEIVQHGQVYQIRKRWREAKENVNIFD